MNLLTATITEIIETEEGRRAKVRIGGAFMRVPLDLVPDASVGDAVLIESGVAIARVEQSKEQKNVSRNSG